jgi:hypothetical protein
MNAAGEVDLRVAAEQTAEAVIAIRPRGLCSLEPVVIRTREGTQHTRNGHREVIAYGESITANTFTSCMDKIRNARESLRSQLFIGIEHQNPVRNQRLERRVAGFGIVVGPRKIYDDSSKLSGNFDGIVG